jgi:hypothetical protein
MVLVNQSTSSLVVTWNQTGIVTNYSVTVTDADDSDTYTVDVDIAARTATISGLNTGGRHYNISVTAISGSQNSISSLIGRLQTGAPAVNLVSVTITQVEFLQEAKLYSTVHSSKVSSWQANRKTKE